jgi:hypothetical protein
MEQPHDEITQTLAERMCWQVARRDDTRIARRLYRKRRVDGVYRLNEGALLDDCFHFLPAIEVMPLLEQVDGTALQRERLPVLQYLLLYGLKTLFGMTSMNALPPWLCSEEAVMPLVGFKAPQVRQGLCRVEPPRGRASARRGRSALTRWPSLSARGTGGPWRRRSMGRFGPWPRRGAWAPRSRALRMAPIWRRPSARPAVVRSPARGGSRISGVGSPRSRSRSTAGTCSCGARPSPRFRGREGGADPGACDPLRAGPGDTGADEPGGPGPSAPGGL